jgi:hypothetical protein
VKGEKHRNVKTKKDEKRQETQKPQVDEKAKDVGDRKHTHSRKQKTHKRLEQQRKQGIRKANLPTSLLNLLPPLLRRFHPHFLTLRILH